MKKTFEEVINLNIYQILQSEKAVEYKKEYYSILLCVINPLCDYLKKNNISFQFSTIYSLTIKQMIEELKVAYEVNGLSKEFMRNIVEKSNEEKKR